MLVGKGTCLLLQAILAMYVPFLFALDAGRCVVTLS
jgi:hypothetical protein